MMASVDKTWATAARHFQQFANDRDEVMTAGAAGYHAPTANLAVVPRQSTDVLGEITLQLANLTARDDSRATALQAVVTELAISKAALQAYKDADNRGGRGSRGGRGGGGQGRGNNRVRDESPRELLYCWTHGMCRHDGASCFKPASKHQADATASNIKGGSQVGR
jgi:hypothetical protein